MKSTLIEPLARHHASQPRASGRATENHRQRDAMLRSLSARRFGDAEWPRPTHLIDRKSVILRLCVLPNQNNGGRADGGSAKLDNSNAPNQAR